VSFALFAPFRGKIIIAAVQGFAGQGEAFSFVAMKCNFPVAPDNGPVGPGNSPVGAYGITAAAVTSVNKEVEEYAAVVSAPQAGIADRKSLTQQMRDRFNAVEALFVALDDLILQFGTTLEGRDLIASHLASRIIRDLGAGPGEPEAPAPAPPTPPPA